MEKILFNDLVYRWYADVVANNLKPTTRSVYRSLLKNHILPVVGNMCISDINSDILLKIQEDKSINKHHKPTSTATSALIRSLLSSVLDYAVENGYLECNCYKDVPSIKAVRKEMRVLSRQEQLKIERAIRYSFEDRAIGVLLSLYCGLRIGEVCALAWSDLDLDANILAVNRTVSRVSVEEAVEGRRTEINLRSAKTLSSIRKIPVPPFLAAQLKQLKTTAVGEYVVNTKKNEPMCTRLMTYIFKKLVTNACISDVNFHALRHTFATRAIESGVDYKAISEILGHANFTITMNTYVHSLVEHKRDIMNKVNPIMNDDGISDLFDASYVNIAKALNINSKDTNIKKGRSISS